MSGKSTQIFAPSATDPNRPFLNMCREGCGTQIVQRWPQGYHGERPKPMYLCVECTARQVNRARGCSEYALIIDRQWREARAEQARAGSSSPLQ